EGQAGEVRRHLASELTGVPGPHWGRWHGQGAGGFVTDEELARLADMVAERLRSGVLAEIRGMVAGPRPAASASKETGCRKSEHMDHTSTRAAGELSSSEGAQSLLDKVLRARRTQPTA